MSDARDRLRDARRLAAVRRVLSLDETDDEDLRRISRLATALLDTPVSLVSLVDDQRQVFAAQTGMEEPWAEGTPLSHSMCRHVVEDDAPLVVDDASEDDRFADHPARTELEVAAYCGVPMRTPDGQVLGSFCVIDRAPRDWTDDEVELVGDLGALAAAELARRVRVEEGETAVLAHDMRAALQGVLGGFRTLAAAGEVDRRERARFVGVVERHARHLERLLDDFLADTGSLADLAVPVELPPLLNVRAEQTPDDGPPVEVGACEPVRAMVVPLALQRCLDDLVGSVPRDSDDAVRLGVRQDGEQAVVTVEVPAAPGRDDRPTSSRAGAGRGVVLSRVRELARSMGGDARAETLDDGGRRYEIRLPAA